MVQERGPQTRKTVSKVHKTNVLAFFFLIGLVAMLLVMIFLEVEAGLVFLPALMLRLEAVVVIASPVIVPFEVVIVAFLMLLSEVEVVLESLIVAVLRCRSSS